MSAFTDHLDKCKQCADNPFQLCREGDRLLVGSLKEQTWPWTGICPSCGRRSVSGGHCDCGWQGEELKAQLARKEKTDAESEERIKRQIEEDDKRIERGTRSSRRKPG